MYRDLPLLPLLLTVFAAACTPGRAPLAPAPAPAPAPPPVPAEEPVARSVEAETPVDAAVPLETTRPFPVAADLLGTAQYDLPMVANRWVQMELEFLVTQRHEVIAGWLRQADRYDEFVRDVFAFYGIPRDLHHLGMVESGYRPTVRSHAGAVGMWQFMSATGRGMGLRIDSLVDERMDPVRATHAAARHLRQLQRAFNGDWLLAAAAYNAGGGRITRGLQRYNARDFWELAERGNLARETVRYVPRLFAVTIIAKNPERFGYPAVSGPVRRFSYDSVRVDLPTPLSELARMGGLTLAELVDYNPHLVRQTAPREYWVWAPPGRGGALQQAFRESEFRRRGGFAYYTVRAGDTLDEVARFTGLEVERIRSMNLSANLDRLGAGNRIRLFADAARLLDARPRRTARREPRDVPRTASRSDSASSRVSARTHTVAEGETVWGIARRYEVSADAVREANDLENESIRPGQTLRIPRAAAASGERGTAAAARTPAERAGTASQRTSTRPREHTVEAGETLWAIARRYETSIDDLRRANGLDADKALQPGQKLVIPW
ncbi:MAG TPA: LysM peptidoglycan-binding domain-containing protein [Longimicrobium sp.]|nr:LysM peptidoglycan-binding domain-containing protein [Longimicrobium sp.]